MRKAKFSLDYANMIILIKAIKTARRPLERRNTGTSAQEGYALLQLQERLEGSLLTVARPAVKRPTVSEKRRKPLFQA